MPPPSQINVAQVAHESNTPVTAVWSFLTYNTQHSLDAQHFITIQTTLEKLDVLKYLPQHPRKGLPYIGIMVPNDFDTVSGNFISNVFAVIKQALVAQRIPFVIYYQTKMNFSDIDTFVKHLSGVLLLCTQRTEEVVAACEAYNTPFVAVEPDTLPQSSLGVTIRGNNYEGQRLAVEHLIALGHRRIAYITGRLSNISAQERLQGYYDALKDAGICIHEDFVREGDWHERKAEQATLELLKMQPRPTAIACANDISALGVYSTLEANRVQIGRDINVIGFDDIEMSNQITPSLSTMRQPIEQIGRLAWDSLSQMLSGNLPVQHELQTIADWVGRGSTHAL